MQLPISDLQLPIEESLDKRSTPLKSPLAKGGPTGRWRLSIRESWHLAPGTSHLAPRTSHLTPNQPGQMMGASVVTTSATSTVSGPPTRMKSLN